LYLDEGGDAVGAVVAGFFAAAGDAPGVLFAPLGLMVAHVGVGVRAFDGRQRQPGIGQRRARGLAPDDPVPVAARVAAPGGIAALLVGLRYGRSVPLSRIISGGVSLAKKAGCQRRADVLEQIQRLGAAALAAPGIARPLIHLAGPSEGGALGLGDLELIPELDHPARSVGSLRVAPWSADPPDLMQTPQSEWDAQAARQHGLCACDPGGGVAALCYDHAISGLRVEALELMLPLNAVPARRGVPRVAPGRFLPAPTPLSIEVSEDDSPVVATVTLAGRVPLSVRAI
jgi:gamma-glutamyltranspeptidase/glutathione hydrolase